MTKRHVWRIKKEYFRQLDRGEKKLEIRVGYPQIKKVHRGDTITFENYGNNEFRVKRVGIYHSFAQMLKAEGVEAVLPGMTERGALRRLQEIYPAGKEALGVYAFELELCRAKDAYSFVLASDLLKRGLGKEFSALVHDSYDMTDWITKDYPDHTDHFYSKYVPGIFDDEREIIACYRATSCQASDEVVAVAFLKKDDEERKISTFYVKPKYRGQGIATSLIEKCFLWLGTTRPLITIADYKLGQFAGIIKKYDWRETQVLEEGYYNDRSKEHVFNGKV